MCCNVHVRMHMQVRNLVYSSLLQLDLPNMVDSGEAEMEKLKTITQRYMYIQCEQNMYMFLMRDEKEERKKQAILCAEGGPGNEASSHFSKMVRERR